MLQFLGLLADRYHGRGQRWYRGDRHVVANRCVLSFPGGRAWYFDCTKEA